MSFGLHKWIQHFCFMGLLLGFYKVPQSAAGEICRSALSEAGSYFQTDSRKLTLDTHRLNAKANGFKPQRVLAFLKSDIRREMDLTQWTLPPNIVLLLAEEYGLTAEEFQEMMNGGTLRTPQKQSVGYLYQIVFQRPSRWNWTELWIFGFDPLHGPRIVEDLVLR